MRGIILCTFGVRLADSRATGNGGEDEKKTRKTFGRPTYLIDPIDLS